MQVAIIGSRKIKRFDLDYILQQIPENCTGIISGGASGMDQLAKQAASRLGLPITEILPDYKKYGRYAPIKRNEEIVQKSDFIIVVWDYESAGTKDSLIKAMRADKPVKVLITRKE